MLPAAEILANPDLGMSTLVASVIAELPLEQFILIVVTVLSILFYATTFDSAAYVIASICTKNLPSHEEPNKFHRLAWAIVLGLVAVGLMVAESLETIKSITVISSLPVIPILFMMIYTLRKWLKEDTGQ